MFFDVDDDVQNRRRRMISFFNFKPSLNKSTTSHNVPRMFSRPDGDRWPCDQGKKLPVHHPLSSQLFSDAPFLLVSPSFVRCVQATLSTYLSLHQQSSQTPQTSSDEGRKNRFITDDESEMCPPGSERCDAGVISTCGGDSGTEQEQVSPLQGPLEVILENDERWN